jgi:hypothetical protein
MPAHQPTRREVLQVEQFVSYCSLVSLYPGICFERINGDEIAHVTIPHFLKINPKLIWRDVRGKSRLKRGS